MTRGPVTTTEAAQRAHVTAATIRTWCRFGAVAAVKASGRWAIDLASLRRRIRITNPLSARRPLDRLPKGSNAPALTGRAARRSADRAQARKTATEYRTRVIGHCERARIAAANTGRTLARDYLTALGLDGEFVAKYESAFGRATAKAYRANHGTDPDGRGLVVLRGRLWRSMRYTDVADLLAGARAYKRTAALVG